MANIDLTKVKSISVETTDDGWSSNIGITFIDDSNIWLGQYDTSLDTFKDFEHAIENFSTDKT